MNTLSPICFVSTSQACEFTGIVLHASVPLTAYRGTTETESKSCIPLNPPDVVEYEQVFLS